MRLDRAGIERLIPHSGAMCLLDEVLDWRADRVRCRTHTHRSPTNPLRRSGRLHVVCGIEYAAQAMALHAALLAGSAAGEPRPGYLASVRGVRPRTAALDDVDGALICEVRRVAGTGGTAIYEFTLAREAEQGDLLLSGRATVVLGE